MKRTISTNSSRGHSNSVQADGEVSVASPDKVSMTSDNSTSPGELEISTKGERKVKAIAALFSRSRKEDKETDGGNVTNGSRSPSARSRSGSQGGMHEGLADARRDTLDPADTGDMSSVSVSAPQTPTMAGSKPKSQRQLKAAAKQASKEEQKRSRSGSITQASPDSSVSADMRDKKISKVDDSKDSANGRIGTTSQGRRTGNASADRRDSLVISQSELDQFLLDPVPSLAQGAGSGSSPTLSTPSHISNSNSASASKASETSVSPPNNADKKGNRPGPAKLEKPTGARYRRNSRAGDKASQNHSDSDCGTGGEAKSGKIHESEEELTSVYWDSDAENPTRSSAAEDDSTGSTSIRSPNHGDRVRAGSSAGGHNVASDVGVRNTNAPGNAKANSPTASPQSQRSNLARADISVQVPAVRGRGSGIVRGSGISRGRGTTSGGRGQPSSARGESSSALLEVPSTSSPDSSDYGRWSVGETAGGAAAGASGSPERLAANSTGGHHRLGGSSSSMDSIVPLTLDRLHFRSLGVIPGDKIDALYAEVMAKIAATENDIKNGERSNEFGKNALREPCNDFVAQPTRAGTCGRCHLPRIAHDLAAKLNEANRRAESASIEKDNAVQRATALENELATLRRESNEAANMHLRREMSLSETLVRSQSERENLDSTLAHITKERNAAMTHATRVQQMEAQLSALALRVADVERLEAEKIVLQRQMKAQQEQEAALVERVHRLKQELDESRRAAAAAAAAAIAPVDLLSSSSSKPHKSRAARGKSNDVSVDLDDTVENSTEEDRSSVSGTRSRRDRSRGSKKVGNPDKKLKTPGGKSGDSATSPSGGTVRGTSGTKNSSMGRKHGQKVRPSKPDAPAPRRPDNGDTTDSPSVVAENGNDISDRPISPRRVAVKKSTQSLGRATGSGAIRKSTNVSTSVNSTPKKSVDSGSLSAGGGSRRSDLTRSASSSAVTAHQVDPEMLASSTSLLACSNVNVTTDPTQPPPPLPPRTSLSSIDFSTMRADKNRPPMTPPRGGSGDGSMISPRSGSLIQSNLPGPCTPLQSSTLRQSTIAAGSETASASSVVVNVEIERANLERQATRVADPTSLWTVVMRLYASWNWLQRDIEHFMDIYAPVLLDDSPEVVISFEALLNSIRLVKEKLMADVPEVDIGGSESEGVNEKLEKVLAELWPQMVEGTRESLNAIVPASKMVASADAAQSDMRAAIESATLRAMQRGLHELKYYLFAPVRQTVYAYGLLKGFGRNSSLDKDASFISEMNGWCSQMYDFLTPIRSVESMKCLIELQIKLFDFPALLAHNRVLSLRGECSCSLQDSLEETLCHVYLFSDVLVFASAKSNCDKPTESDLSTLYALYLPHVKLIRSPTKRNTIQLIGMCIRTEDRVNMDETASSGFASLGSVADMRASTSSTAVDLNLKFGANPAKLVDMVSTLCSELDNSLRSPNPLVNPLELVVLDAVDEDEDEGEDEDIHIPTSPSNDETVDAAVPVVHGESPSTVEIDVSVDTSSAPATPAKSVKKGKKENSKTKESGLASPAESSTTSPVNDKRASASKKLEDRNLAAQQKKEASLAKKAEQEAKKAAAQETKRAEKEQKRRDAEMKKQAKLSSKSPK